MLKAMVLVFSFLGNSVLASEWHLYETRVCEHDAVKTRIVKQLISGVDIRKSSDWGRCQLVKLPEVTKRMDGFMIDSDNDGITEQNYVLYSQEFGGKVRLYIERYILLPKGGKAV